MQTATKTPVIISSPDFAHGYRNGRSWFTSGDTPYQTITEEQIVQFIRDNILEPFTEGYLDDVWLVDHMGFLAGWMSGTFV